MSNSIFPGASAFMQSLRDRSLESENRLYVQAMTFEGDKAGEELAEIIIKSPAKDKRLLIDSFSKVVVSDHFVFGPKYLVDKAFRQEISNSGKLVGLLKADGVKVKFTNPVGLLAHRYPLRNHKKMVILDDVAYVGGINFSDHNFSWHDMMVAFRQPFVYHSMTEDFLQTWSGLNQSKVVENEDTTVFFLNGRRSQPEYRKLFDYILSAKKSITLVSPYVSGPFLRILEEAHHRGISVNIFSTGSNNKSLFQENLIEESQKRYFDLYIRDEMTHMKAILLDEERLIVGSSNFDVVSYYFEQELLIGTGDRELIEAFQQNVLSPLSKESRLFEARGSFRGNPVPFRFLDLFCRIASGTFLRVK